jgi:hypothetical protein
MHSRLVPALVFAALLIIGASASPASAGVIAPPNTGGLTGSVHFSCSGRAGVPTATVVVHNSHDAHFGVSIWVNGPQLLSSLPVPGHTTQQATFSDATWEDTTVFIDVLRIGGVVVTSGSHHFDCQAGAIVAGAAGADVLTPLRRGHL